MSEYILALDQGTTSSRAIVFTRDGQVKARAQKEFRQLFPQPGWVEHDPLEIWSTQSGVMQEALSSAGGHRHHQPAGNRSGVEPQDRATHPQRHRVAGSPHGGLL